MTKKQYLVSQMAKLMNEDGNVRGLVHVLKHMSPFPPPIGSVVLTRAGNIRTIARHDLSSPMPVWTTAGTYLTKGESIALTPAVQAVLDEVRSGISIVNCLDKYIPDCGE